MDGGKACMKRDTMQIGGFTIGDIDEKRGWITKNDGEGTEFDKKDLEIVLEKWFSEYM